MYDSEPNFWLLQVVNRAELLFSEVLNGLSHIGEKRSSAVLISGGPKTPELRRQVAELEGMLQKEKLEFEVRSSVIILDFIASFSQVPCLVMALYTVISFVFSNFWSLEI